MYTIVLTRRICHRVYMKYGCSLPPFFLSPGQYGVAILCFSDQTKLSAWSGNLGSFVILPEPDEDYDIWNMGLVNLRGRGGRFAVADRDGMS